MMTGWREVVLAAAVAIASTAEAWGQVALGPPGQRPDDVWEPKLLEVDPAAEPTPVLKYRLVPISSELTPGDAAPVYLRQRHEIGDGAWQTLGRGAVAWLEAPFETFPVNDARRLVDQWRVRLGQFDIAARRSTCDWGYPVVEQRREIINIILPDAQEMRLWSRLVALRARVEIHDRTFDDAVRTLQTGLAMGRHLGSGPFLINGLVGIAVCHTMLDRVEEFIARPGAPNLYWALSVLPTPLVSLRDAYEMEQRLGENLVPALDELESPHTPEEWNVLLASLYRDLQRLAGWLVGESPDDSALKETLTADLEAFRTRFGDEARAWLASTSKADASDAEALARYLGFRYRAMRDAAFRSVYLPYAEAKAFRQRQQDEVKQEKSGPVAVFAALMPGIEGAQRAGVRLDRRVAALRVVEAIRLHAAAHDGRLPNQLDDIDLVPVPVDPATDEPFAYAVEENEAVLSAGRIENQTKTELAYRIRLR
ncbi:MAG: hypothetical protein KatS3mg108_0758 [Isosphaeraceae bacterium]|jgi:hypothetical protein|nr:MAG: hypothetical protein KatS3mg108_0758 [Isosphaeraceae bacterium]